MVYSTVAFLCLFRSTLGYVHSCWKLLLIVRNELAALRSSLKLQRYVVAYTSYCLVLMTAHVVLLSHGELQYISGHYIWPHLCCCPKTSQDLGSKFQCEAVTKFSVQLYPELFGLLWCAVLFGSL